MVSEKLEHYFFICLITQLILTFTSAKPVESEFKLFSNRQLRTLARSVCDDLNFEQVINVTFDSCVENFIGPDLTALQSPPSVKIRCQTSAGIRYELQPSQNWQLVVLVPEDRTNATNNDTEDDFYSYINYNLKQPNSEHGKVSTTPVQRYTIFTTELDHNGAPIQWQGGDDVPLYKQAEHKEYDIRLQFIMNPDSMSVNGFFHWNTSGGFDMCFDVVNSCDNTVKSDAKLWPKDKARVQFYNLSLNDNCDIKVTGMYGTTKLDYHTPLSGTEPDYAKNITLWAVEDSPSTWRIEISWDTPLLQPDRYNVTVKTNNVYTIVVPGNETHVVFRGIEGKGIYTVSVDAKLAGRTAHTSRRGLFHRSEQPDGGARDAAATGGAAAGAAAAAALLYCCRRRKHIPAPQEPPEDKPPKEGDTEALSVCQSEDSWEVPSDKLLLHEVIGEGAFGVVRRATLSATQQDVAVKMLKDFPSLDEIRSFRSEMELMKSVGAHPHLVSLVGCCSGRRPLIIAEYCSRGDLLSYLRCTWDIMISRRNAKYYNNNINTSDYRNDLFKIENSRVVVNKLYELQDICDKELTSLDLLSFCRQIAIGMEFLAANRVVHRDLAARNVLVTADRTLKIADFGLSRDVYEENQYKQKGNGKMPVKWMAIESLTRRIYTTQSDVWSFGVVAWEVATVGGAPYAGVAPARLPRLLRHGYRMPRPGNCSPALYDIMLSCWRAHPRDRPTFAELHQRLDELLNSACANDYLTLELEADEPPPTPKHHRYLKMLIRGKRNWSRGESYERPLKPPQSNHYSSPPAVLPCHVCTHE